MLLKDFDQEVRVLDKQLPADIPRGILFASRKKRLRQQHDILARPTYACMMQSFLINSIHAACTLLFVASRVSRVPLSRQEQEAQA